MLISAFKLPLGIPKSLLNPQTGERYKEVQFKKHNHHEKDHRILLEFVNPMLYIFAVNLYVFEMSQLLY